MINLMADHIHAVKLVSGMQSKTHDNIGSFKTWNDVNSTFRAKSLSMYRQRSLFNKKNPVLHTLKTLIYKYIAAIQLHSFPSNKKNKKINGNTDKLAKGLFKIHQHHMKDLYGTN